LGSFTPRARLIRLVGPAIIGAAVVLTAAPPAPADAATRASRIISVAKAQLGDPWVYGAEGPNRFDCSGLVIYAFQKTGNGSVVGNGRYRSARALYLYFKAKGRASRSGARPGDLVVWGGGSHIGIYIGNGKAVSTLTSGVRVHGVHAVTARFTAYLHTGLSGTAARATTHHAAKTKDTRQTVTRINFRTGPGLHYRIKTVLATGTRVAVGSRKDGHGRTWIHVRTLGQTGWVARWLTR
jgi:NlpC/P60 family